MEDGTYTIGEFSRMSGLSPRTIDFYTRQGLLHPRYGKNGHGYRYYGEKDSRRISLIRQLKARKFSLQEIRRIVQTNGQRPAVSLVEDLEKVGSDLERLQEVVKKSRSAMWGDNIFALRIIATQALQKAMALSAQLLTLLQDPPHR